MNLNDILKHVKQAQRMVETAKGQLSQVKQVTESVNQVITEAKAAIEPAKAAAQQVEQALNSIKQGANAVSLTQLGAAILALKAAFQIGKPTAMETMSHFNKAIVALIMSALIIVETLTGFSLGLTEGTLTTILAVITPILVWAIPNYPG